MPKIFSGRRRWLLAQLACLGSLEALLAIVMSLSLAAVVAGDSSLGTVLVASALGIGLGQWIQKVLAEDLGQDYVHEVRRLLVGAALLPDNSASLGVTITRASNDLSALKNWIAFGIVPLITGLPLIGVVLTALFWMDHRTGWAVVVPLAVALSLLPVVAAWTLQRTRELRRKRGRLAARIADATLAGEGIRAAGAIPRELNAISRDSDKVVQAALKRSWATGLGRAIMVLGASMSMISVVLAGHLQAHETAGTMLLLGILATPISDLGRVMDYRQNYRAACMILAPIVEKAQLHRATEAALPSLKAIPELSGIKIGELIAQPGERIHLKGSPEETRAFIKKLIDDPAAIVNGQNLKDLKLQDRRALMAIASAHLPLSRGTVSRLVSFRVPQASTAEIQEVLAQVGLKNDAKTLKTKLKNGGQPWSTTDINKLKLAAALLRQPPLIVVEDFDPSCINNYPGVLISTIRPQPKALESAQDWRAVELGAHIRV